MSGARYPGYGHLRLARCQPWMWFGESLQTFFVNPQMFTEKDKNTDFMPCGAFDFRRGGSHT